MSKEKNAKIILDVLDIDYFLEILDFSLANNVYEETKRNKF